MTDQSVVLPGAPPQSAPLPPLRQDLQLNPGPRNGDGTSNWLIYDPVRHRYFEIGEQTFALLGLWKETDGAAFIKFASTTLQREVTAGELEELVKFLYTNNLTDTAIGNDARAYAQQVAATKRSLISHALHNYLFFKIPLVRPHRFLERTLPFVAPLYTWTAFYLILLTTVVGVYLASRQWETFTTTFMDFLSLQGLAYYGLSLVFIKVLHELGHAYTATRAGARVNTMGIAFMLLFPIMFTDVTDAWKLKSRRQKVAIAGAGMAVELMVAGISTFLWVFLADGPARSVAFVLATTSWIMSLAVNLNPFMRFDGYYLLSDSWGVSNLQSRAFAMAQWWLREQLFDLRHPPPENFQRSKRNWIVAYAIGTWIYRFFLFLGIALLVYHMFFKVLGVALFVVEIAWFIVLPIGKEFLEWWKMRDQISKTRRSAVAAAIAGTLFALAIVPWSATVYVPAVALAEREFRVFAPRAAQFVKVSLEDDARVSEGTQLAALTSPALDHEISSTRLRIRLARARLRRIAGDKDDLSQLGVNENELAKLHEKLSGLLSEQKQLIVVSPFSSKVRDILPGVKAGDWIDKTTRIARLVAAGGLEAHGYVHADNFWKIKAGNKAIFIPEDPLIASRAGRVIDIAQAGSHRLDLKYLSSVFGGDIASDKDEGGDIIPRSGRYLVKIALDGKPLGRVARGTLHISGHPESFISAAWRRIIQVLVRESSV